MLPKMASEIFDHSDEIQLLEEALDRYGIEPEDFFYLCRACQVIAAICPVFEAEKLCVNAQFDEAEGGIIVTAFGSLCEHQIAVQGGFVSTASIAIDDRRPNAPEPSIIGRSSLPLAWLGVLRRVFKAERAILWQADFTSRVKAEWSEYLRFRKERLGF
jgi:hypothetical protein